jgi:hypothetical protein
MFTFTLYSMFTSSLDCLFVFHLPVGPHPPNGHKPTAEGGGLSLLVVFLLYFVLFFIDVAVTVL